MDTAVYDVSLFRTEQRLLHETNSSRHQQHVLGMK